jgi:Rha family phage regulatory protein
MSAILPFTPDVHLVGGIPKTTSHNVAQVFGKRHDNVIRSIKNMDCSPEFAALNFEASTYIDPNGRSRPMYELTRDGFTFLAMGFTGKEAARWKEAYIAAFNGMAEQLALGERADVIIVPKSRYIEMLERLVFRAPRQGSGKPRPWHPEEDAAALDLRAQGLGCARIGYRLGRSTDSVRNRLRRLGGEL